METRVLDLEQSSATTVTTKQGDIRKFLLYIQTRTMLHTASPHPIILDVDDYSTPSTSPRPSRASEATTATTSTTRTMTGTTTTSITPPMSVNSEATPNITPSTSTTSPNKIQQSPRPISVADVPGYDVPPPVYSNNNLNSTESIAMPPERNRKTCIILIIMWILITICYVITLIDFSMSSYACANTKGISAITSILASSAGAFMILIVFLSLIVNCNPQKSSSYFATSITGLCCFGFTISLFSMTLLFMAVSMIDDETCLSGKFGRYVAELCLCSIVASLSNLITLIYTIYSIHGPGARREAGTLRRPRTAPTAPPTERPPSYYEVSTPPPKYTQAIEAMNRNSSHIEEGTSSNSA